jgi:hypothetical protein
LFGGQASSGEAKGSARKPLRQQSDYRAHMDFVECLRCGRKTTKYCGRAATLRKPPRGFDFNPPLRFLLRDETGDVVVLAVGPCNSDVPSTR